MRFMEAHLSNLLWSLWNFCFANYTTQLDAVCKLAESALNPTVDATDEELQASQIHLYAWHNHGADPPEDPTKAHGK